MGSRPEDLVQHLLVDADLALKLRYLKFNEYCIGYYDGNHKLQIVEKSFKYCVNSKVSIFVTIWDRFIFKKYKSYCTAPTWEQAFKWFESVHGFYTQIYPKDQQFIWDNDEWFYIINNRTIDTNEVKITSYEEARRLLLIELIEKIIE